MAGHYNGKIGNQSNDPHKLYQQSKQTAKIATMAVMHLTRHTLAASSQISRVDPGGIATRLT